MPKYCCFFHPAADTLDHTLDDSCPECGRSYGFPKDHAPKSVDQYVVLRYIDRGFYSATYLVEQGSLVKTKFVMKVCPKLVYTKFGKNFEEECRLHQELADSCSEHFVKLYNAFEADIDFDGTLVPSWVSILSDEQGTPLDELLDTQDLSAETAAQLAIDLFSIMGALHDKQLFHNDLHGRNLLVRQLSEGNRRYLAIDGSIRVMAIDLGSADEATKSDEKRWGDKHWIASHVERIAQNLLHDVHSAEDVTVRVGYALLERIQVFKPKAEEQRYPSASECIKDISHAFSQSNSPWLGEVKLESLGDYYNAQTIHPWYIPHLLVDPDGSWITELSSPGPQIITGMRGCGKTMLLRALEFHARGARQYSGEQTNKLIDRIKSDPYIGLYVSSTRLLDNLGREEQKLGHPYEKLFSAYALKAIQAVRHLRDIVPDEVSSEAFRQIAQAVADSMSGTNELMSARTELEIERRLVQLNKELQRGSQECQMLVSPSVAFTSLADQVLSVSPMWQGKRVLFLLDDVSTRYLTDESVSNLFSRLTFQESSCAFKFTTEGQTLIKMLRSPGLIESAERNREYLVFDLGAAVNRQLSSNGKVFLGNVLDRRSKYLVQRPPASPSKMLGDTSLESIAEIIAGSARTSNKRNNVYHGFTALRAVCVGDIGDVILLYEEMLKANTASVVPIPAEVQSSCYQQFCSRKLFDLKRRDKRLLGFALGFAKAANVLLQRSKVSDTRLRQYTKIYVRIQDGDVDWAFDEIRKLIDSGVFVLEEGSDTPRTKVKDGNPVHQFILTFRKFYGLSHYIGLSDRDRFELTGEQLSEWLREPEKGEEILIRNQALSVVSQEEMDYTTVDDNRSYEPSVAQPLLFSAPIVAEEADREPSLLILPKVSEIPISELASHNITTLVAGLGFEMRTLVSFQRVLASCSPKRILFAGYRDLGNSEAMYEAARKAGINDILRAEYGKEDLDCTSYSADGDCLVDVTGLAKPLIVAAIMKALSLHPRVFLAHTRAEDYYPKDSDIQRILEAEQSQDVFAQLDSLSSIIQGEAGPYTMRIVFEGFSDESRKRVLIAFASPKHERLLSFLELRDFDHVDVVAHRADSPRGQVSRKVAEVAAGMVNSAMVFEQDTDDIFATMKFLLARFQHWYVHHNCTLELVLTGSKLQSVATALACHSLKIAKCWYVSPAEFESSRFTDGVAQTTLYVAQVR